MSTEKTTTTEKPATETTTTTEKPAVDSANVVTNSPSTPQPKQNP